MFLQNNTFGLSPASAAENSAHSTGSDLDAYSESAVRILFRAIIQSTQRQRQQQGRRNRNDQGAALLRQRDQANHQKEAARELLKSGAFGIVDFGFGHDGVWRTGAARRNEIVKDESGPARKVQSGNGAASLNLTNRIWNRESRWKPTSKVALGRVSR